MLGAHFDSWHGGHRRDRQRRRLGHHARGDADPEGVRPQDAPHGAPRALERRRAGPARLARLREETRSPTARRWRSSPSTGSSPATSTWTTAPAPSAASTCRATRPSRRSSAAWMKPFANLGMTTLTMQNTGGTDHLSFDAVGLPGLPVHPGSPGVRHAHAPLEHGQLRAAAGGDMMKNAVIVASFVYHAANRDRSCRASRCRRPQRRTAGGRGRRTVGGDQGWRR